MKPYWFKSYIRRVRLVTNLEANWNDEEDAVLDDGWATLSGGWLVAPVLFKVHHPRACMFSRLEPNKEEFLVRMWLYTPSVREFYNTKVDRDLFMCWVDPDYLYELSLL